MATAEQAKKTKRDQLVDTAIRLFGRHGFHATGIDTILKEASVAKMTLYNNFASKDELAVAAVEEKSDRFLSALRQWVETRAESPRGRLLALFDFYGDWFSAGNFAGCFFINACAEFADAGHDVHKAAAAAKQDTFAYIEKLAGDAGAANPHGLAEQLMLLLEGATAIAQVSSAPIAARRAKRAADTLITGALA